MSFRSQKLRDAAKNYDCVLCETPGKTVGAHPNRVALGKGVGCKAHDCYLAYVCDRCHGMIDGQIKLDEKYSSPEECWTIAYLRTVLIWFQDGLVRVK